MLAFLPLSFLLDRPRRILASPLVQLTLSALVGIIVWLFINPSILAPRFLLATLFMFVPVLAKGAETVMDQSRTRLLAVGTYVALFAALSFSLVTVGVYSSQAVKYVSGVEGACEYERASCRAMSALSQDADLGDRIFRAEAHTIWLRADLMQCLSERAELGATLDAPTTEDRWAYLVERGFRYIAINPSSYAEFIDALDFDQVPDWIEISELFQEGAYSVYQISSTDSGRQPSVECRRVDPPAWKVVPTVSS